MTYDPTQHIEGIRRLIATREKKAKGEILTKISSATRNQAKHVCVLRSSQWYQQCFSPPSSLT